MAANNPSNAFQARCSVAHNPPDPPFFVTNRGFKSVVLDTSEIPAGAYILELEDTTLNPDINQIIGCYHSDAGGEADLGVIFTGHLGLEVTGRFAIVRFQVVPGNTPLNGPFQITIVNLQ